VTRTTTTRLIAEQSPNLKGRKRLALKPKLDPERNLWLLFPFWRNNAVKRRLKPEKTASSKKRTKEGWIHPLFFSTEINLTTSSDEDTSEEYMFPSSKPFRSSKTKLAK
jgi:hypothetical protein